MATVVAAISRQDDGDRIDRDERTRWRIASGIRSVVLDVSRPPCRSLRVWDASAGGGCQVAALEPGRVAASINRGGTHV
jgi:hypothetical protein